VSAHAFYLICDSIFHSTVQLLFELFIFSCFFFLYSKLELCHKHGVLQTLMVDAACHLKMEWVSCDLALSINYSVDSHTL